MLGPVRESIAEARAAEAELVVFTIHWGPNMVQRPRPLFRDFAHAVIDLGADVFFGHSAHVFQGIELYRGRPIIYDAGDFVDDYVVDPELRNDWGLLFRLEADGAGVERIGLIPAVIRHRQVNRAVGSEREAIAERMESLSAELGTTIRRDGDRLSIHARGPRTAASGPESHRGHDTSPRQESDGEDPDRREARPRERARQEGG